MSNVSLLECSVECSVECLTTFRFRNFDIPELIPSHARGDWPWQLQPASTRAACGNSHANAEL